MDTFQVKMNILSYPKIFETKLNVFQIETSLLQIKLPALQDGWRKIWYNFIRIF